MRAYGPVPLPPPKSGKEGTRTGEGQRSLGRAAQLTTGGNQTAPGTRTRTPRAPTIHRRHHQAVSRTRRAAPASPSSRSHLRGALRTGNPFGRLCHRIRAGSLGH